MNGPERRVIADIEASDSPDKGRVIEIGMVEMVGNRMTGREWASRFWPDGSPVSCFATKVHGIRLRDLRGEPRFSRKLGQVMSFIGSSRVFFHGVHNDREHLDKEFVIAGAAPMPRSRFVDTEKLVRIVRPGERSGMTALILDVLREERPKRHGALEDARYLARVLSALAPETAQGLDAVMSGARRKARAPATTHDAQGWVRPGIGEGVSEGLSAEIAEASSVEDAMRLRTGGNDLWSFVPGSEIAGVIRGLVGSDFSEETEGLNDKRRNTALRWIGRGLSPDLAIGREFAFEATDPPSP